MGRHPAIRLLSWRVAARLAGIFSDEDNLANNKGGACLYAFYQDQPLCGGVWFHPFWRM
jgi:hypothetical protein